MHQRLSLFVFMLVALVLVTALPAQAQVTVNPGALDQLGGAPAARPPPAAAPSSTGPAHPAPHRAADTHTPPHRAAETHPPAHQAAPSGAAHAAAHPATPPPAKPKPPVVPPVPPPEAVLKPLEPPPPAHPTTPPPPPPVVAEAVGDTTPIPQGVRVTFGPDSADLNPRTDQVVQELAHSAPTAIFNVTAFAPGNADDPSTPRRLSLSRALAVRSALINAGVPSTRIYAHAMGPSIADGPPDRVDLTATVPAVPVAPATAPAPTVTPEVGASPAAPAATK